MLARGRLPRGRARSDAPSFSCVFTTNECREVLIKTESDVPACLLTGAVGGIPVVYCYRRHHRHSRTELHVRLSSHTATNKRNTSVRDQRLLLLELTCRCCSHRIQRLTAWRQRRAQQPDPWHPTCQQILRKRSQAPAGLPSQASRTDLPS